MCERRVFLRARGETEEPPGPFELLLREFGLRHEREHLKTFGSYADLSNGSRQEREQRTAEAVRSSIPVLYQPAFRRVFAIQGKNVEITGDPDFLIWQDGHYAIRDCKLARRVTEQDHPEILRQVELYGWLCEPTLGQRPSGLEIYNGVRELVPLPYDGGHRALGLVEEIVALKAAAAEPFSPVGWSKCNGCGFHGRCWPAAVEARDVAIVPGVDQGLTVALRKLGISTIDQLLANLDVRRLAGLRRTWGTRLRVVGSKSEGIFRMAKAIASGTESMISPPAIPSSPNYVVLDLEGVPPYFDDLDKIYLWGLRVYGDRPGPHMMALIGFGANGDQEGWETFLATAENIFNEYGDPPFVHWSQYERVRLDVYLERFGDRRGIGARVRADLCDLLRATQNAVALPLPSYSLKVVEKHVGFERTLLDTGGAWAIAKYIEAVETEDIAQRAALIDEVRAYNEEDLAATWAVLRWLKTKTDGLSSGLLVEGSE